MALSLDSQERQKARGYRPLQGVGGPHKHAAKRTAAESSQPLMGSPGYPWAGSRQGPHTHTHPPRRGLLAAHNHQETLGSALTLHQLALRQVLRAASVGRVEGANATGPAAGLGTGAG